MFFFFFFFCNTIRAWWETKKKRLSYRKNYIDEFGWDTFFSRTPFSHVIFKAPMSPCPPPPFKVYSPMKSSVHTCLAFFYFKVVGHVHKYEAVLWELKFSGNIYFTYTESLVSAKAEIVLWLQRTHKKVTPLLIYHISGFYGNAPTKHWAFSDIFFSFSNSVFYLFF